MGKTTPHGLRKLCHEYLITGLPISENLGKIEEA